MGKKLFIGYVHPDRVKTEPIDYAIKKASSPEEKKQIEKLCLDTYGELDFIERGKWYNVRKMNNVIALKGKDVLGFASWIKEKKELFLLAILVKLNYQRRGIATALLNKIKEIASGLKVQNIIVPVSNDDLVSYVFYQVNGFRIFGIDIGLPEKRHGKEKTGFWGLPCRDEFYCIFQAKSTILNRG